MLNSKSHISERRTVSSKLIESIDITLGCSKLDGDSQNQDREGVVSELLTSRPELIIARLRVIANKGTCERYEGDEQIVFVDAGMNAPRGSF